MAVDPATAAVDPFHEAPAVTVAAAHSQADQAMAEAAGLPFPPAAAAMEAAAEDPFPAAPATVDLCGGDLAAAAAVATGNYAAARTTISPYNKLC